MLGLVKSGEVYASVALDFADDMAQVFTLVTMIDHPTARATQPVGPQEVLTD